MKEENREDTSIVEKEFANILKTFSNQDEFIKLLNYILKIDLENIEFIGIERYENISEYNFYLFKLKGILKDSIKIEIYLKFIKKGEVRESVYCYYSLLYNNLKIDKEKSRVRIIEKESNFIKSKIIICIDNKQINDNLELNLFNLKRMIEEDTDRVIKKYKKQIDSNDILLVGIKYL